jgi:transposase
MQFDLTALPEDSVALQSMVRDAVTAALQRDVQLAELTAEIEKLQALINKLLRHRFGRRSEQLSADQLNLAVEDIEQEAAEQAAAEDAANQSEEQRRRRHAAHKRRNLGALPAHLPRYEVVIDLDSKVCPCCGAALHLIGETRAEMLDRVPAQLRVKVTRRPRYGCRACGDAVVQAPAPERPIDGGMATEALLAQVVVNKFCDFLPLYRQAEMLKREGITIDRSTLSDWVGRACWWLRPLYNLMVSSVLSSPKVFADDTTLPVLDPGRGKTKTGRLWCYAVDDRPWKGPTHPAAAYIYSENRKATHPTAHLVNFRGVLQVDGYNGFANLVTGRRDNSIQLAFCWAELPKVPPAQRVEWQRRATQDGRSTSFTSPTSRRSPPKRSRASASSTTSRRRFVAISPSIAALSVNSAAVRLSRHCTPGCKSSCRDCPAVRRWRPPCAMPCGTGPD